MADCPLTLPTAQQELRMASTLLAMSDRDQAHYLQKRNPSRSNPCGHLGQPVSPPRSAPTGAGELLSGAWRELSVDEETYTTHRQDLRPRLLGRVGAIRDRLIRHANPLACCWGNEGPSSYPITVSRALSSRSCPGDGGGNLRCASTQEKHSLVRNGIAD